jgi:hypothetical protein
MAPAIYIETTIPSYLTAWPSGDLVRAAHQKMTKDWWATRRPAFELFVSQFVLDEVSGGDSEAALARLNVLEGIPLLPVTNQVQELSVYLIDALSIPPKAIIDAAHIAISACNGIDFLLTWNCKHINNAELLPRIENACQSFGLSSPVICTPEELMGI